MQYISIQIHVVNKLSCQLMTFCNFRFDSVLGFILSSLEKTLLLVNLVTVPGSMFIVINFLELLHLITWVSITSIWQHTMICVLSGSEIALSWSPMQLKILHWRPEFHSWSPHFPIWRMKKKRSVTSWRLPKKVNFRPC